MCRPGLVGSSVSFGYVYRSDLGLDARPMERHLKCASPVGDPKASGASVLERRERATRACSTVLIKGAPGVRGGLPLQAPRCQPGSPPPQRQLNGAAC